MVLNSSLSAQVLGLEAKPGGLIVMIVNSTIDDIKVNKRLAIGPSGSRAELNFDVLNENKVAFSNGARIRLGAPEKDDWCILAPSQFVGKSISIDALKRMFDLPRGHYRVKARYENNEGDGFRGKLESEWVDIVI
jgi:hypothetical protein